MRRLRAQGKYLFEGERKFLARGVSYGPFAPNSRSEPYPEPGQVGADFDLIRELGCNLIRTYTLPPAWLVELAVHHDLRLMAGIPWPCHMTFLDSRALVRDIRQTIRRGVSELRKFGEAIFAYSLGNEIRSDIVRWHGPAAVRRFLVELYEAAKELDPEGLVTYSNYPSTEYLDLSFLDLICFNVYLHGEPDFRRYLTRVLALSGERPVVLSETGMDTIGEGEERQADLLAWQARAAFELGLSGFVVFAFTDDWYSGASQIAEWAFGLVTKERKPKHAFGALAEVFQGELPPALPDPPRVSVVVAAYNAARTLGPCLESLFKLAYPDFEIMVADDGSVDSTRALAEAAGARLLPLEHRGLAAARNAAIRAASGEVVAFIDADAVADRDWLYHLVETLNQRAAAAAGGPNFPPAPASALAAALAGAPGAPREVPLGDDQLEQLCGCNMALDRGAVEAVGGFDPLFERAGDDVDLSWRLREQGKTIAYAPGAVVIHQRRPTRSSYLAQQAGYGEAEGLLFRKYPRPASIEGSIYGIERLWSGLGAKVYHGVFGRGLFQSLYPSTDLPRQLLQAPLTVQWLGLALLLLIGGAVSRLLGLLGLAGVIMSLMCASAGALLVPIEKPCSGPVARLNLLLLWFLGPLVRSCARERNKFTIGPHVAAPFRPRRGEPLVSGQMVIGGTDGALLDADVLVAALRASLVRRGLAAGPGDRFQPYDLQIVIPPAIRVALNVLEVGQGRLRLGWRLALAWRGAAVAAALVVILSIMMGISWRVALPALTSAALAFAVLGLWRIRWIPTIIRAAANDVCREKGLYFELHHD